MRTIAALYVDLPRGPYAHLEGVEPWGVTRDARTYAGPGPIVAHPPCGPWGRLRHLYRGNEHDCGPRAVEQVRKWGGVLEHPAGSKLWEACGLPRPLRRREETPTGWRVHVCGRGGTRCDCDEERAYDAFGGYTIDLDQCEWGHVARKRTWLYLVGVPRPALEAPPFPGRGPTHWIIGFRSTTRPRTYERTGSAVPAGIKMCSAQQRRRTPPLFAEYLVRLARAVVR